VKGDGRGCDVTLKSRSIPRRSSAIEKFFRRGRHDGHAAGADCHDSEDNLYYLRTLLGAYGYEVESAVHGAEALKKPVIRRRAWSSPTC
jgi:hypothetical protein